MSLLGVKGFLGTKNVSDYFTQVSKLLETFSANVVIDFFFNLSWQPKQLKQEALLCVVFWGRKFFLTIPFFTYKYGWLLGKPHKFLALLSSLLLYVLESEISSNAVMTY